MIALIVLRYESLQGESMVMEEEINSRLLALDFSLSSGSSWLK